MASRAIRAYHASELHLKFATMFKCDDPVCGCVNLLLPEDDISIIHSSYVCAMFPRLNNYSCTFRPDLCIVPEYGVLKRITRFEDHVFRFKKQKAPKKILSSMFSSKKIVEASALTERIPSVIKLKMLKKEKFKLKRLKKLAVLQSTRVATQSKTVLVDASVNCRVRQFIIGDSVMITYGKTAYPGKVFFKIYYACV